MWIHYFSYVVVNGESQNHRHLRWVELVVVFQPAGHHGCGALQGFGQRVGYPDRHKVFVVLGARSAHCFAANQINGELDLHRSLQGVSSQLAIPLRGMTIADIEQRAGLIDRKVQCCVFADLVVVHVAAIVPQIAGEDRLVAAGSHADASKHWLGGTVKSFSLSVGLASRATPCSLSSVHLLSKSFTRCLSTT